MFNVLSIQYDHKMLPAGVFPYPFWDMTTHICLCFSPAGFMMNNLNHIQSDDMIICFV